MSNIVCIDYNYTGHKYNKISTIIRYVCSENINQFLFSADIRFLIDYCRNININDFGDGISIKQTCNFISGTKTLDSLLPAIVLRK